MALVDTNSLINDMRTKLNFSTIPGWCKQIIVNELQSYPAAEAIPVVHTTFELRKNAYYCKNCGAGYSIKMGHSNIHTWKCCPLCMALFDGEERK